MAKELDVYRDWLGVQETTRPLNHYQLLRLKQFEDDPTRIRANYRKLNAHVRKYATGEFSQQSQELLNELAKAMLCLTDSRRKEEYDATLGRVAAGKRRRYTLEQILVGRRLLTTDQLTKARNYASAINIELRDAVIQQKLADPESVMQAFAESVGLPYIDLDDIGVDLALVPLVPALVARQHSCAPVMVDDGTLLVASPNPLRPDVEEELRLRTGLPVRTVICTVGGIRDVIDQHYPKSAAAAEMGIRTPSRDPADTSARPESNAAGEELPEAPHERQSVNQAQILVTMVAFLVTFVFAFLLLKMDIGKLHWAAIAGWAVAGVVYAILRWILR